MDIISINEVTKCLFYMVNKMIFTLASVFIFIKPNLSPKGNTQRAPDASHFYYICIGFLTFTSNDRSYTKSTHF